MATLGLFSPELVPKAWFDPELYPLAWFDPTLVGESASAVVQDSAVYVSTFVGVETVGTYVVGDVAVVVQAVAPAEAEATLVVTDAGVFVQAICPSEAAAYYEVPDTAVNVTAFAGVDTASLVVADSLVFVTAFVGVEIATLTTLDGGANVEAFATSESLDFGFEDSSVPVEVSAPDEIFVQDFDNASAFVEALAAPETFDFGFVDAGVNVTALVFAETFGAPSAAVADVAVAVQVDAPSESWTVTPAPGPSPQPRPILAGGTPLEDYEVGGYTLRELREVRESLLEEIIELPVREESAEDKREREAGEPRFSEFLKRIIEEPVKPKAEKKATNWLPAVAIGAFLLGAWLATSGESEAFAGEEPEDDLLPDDLPDDGLDLDDDLLFEGETLPLQGPEHAGELSELPELPELVESIEFRGEDFQEGEIPLESLSPEVADEELLRSIRQEAEDERPKPKVPRKRRTSKARALTSEPETVLAFRPGRGRA